MIDLASSGVRHVADGGAPIYNDGAIEGEAPAWAADGRSFYYRALVDGSIGIWEAQADGSGNHAIIVRDADVESFELSSDRKVLAFVTGPISRRFRSRPAREPTAGGKMVSARWTAVARSKAEASGRFSDADGNRRGAGYGPSTGSSLFVVDRAADARARRIRSLGHAA